MAVVLKNKCMWLIFLCFLMTSCCYLSWYYNLAGFGLLFGRLGDTIGALGCTILSDLQVVLVFTATFLFAAAVLTFFVLYHRIYVPVSEAGARDSVSFDDLADKYNFSAREREVMRLVIDGLNNSEITDVLYISESTVKFHVRNLLKKTGCKDRMELAAVLNSQWLFA
ncbi:MAG: hypothetical protein IJT96_07210 [Lachnospiraceae bacterium]|nr:hypothetical protein [Lachnospiraceae bacterium]